jgi:hypothetical protein
MHDRPQVYFSALDRQMESFLDSEALQRSLVYGVLFHGDLIIPDIYLYASLQLATLIQANAPTRKFLQCCLKNGAIVPAFRKDPKGNFHDNLNHIRSGGIQSIHAEADSIAGALQEAVHGKKLHYRLWPRKPLSVGYKTTVERALLGETLPSDATHLAKFWEQTAELRNVTVGQCKLDNLGGFRRNDLYNSLAAHLKVTPTPVQDIRTIWSGLDSRPQSAIVQRLLKWINYCYYYNHGRMFDLDPSLASLDELDRQFASHLVQLNDKSSAGPLVSQGFQLPSVDALLTVDPDRIFEVRDSEVGESYFSSLAKWKEHPSDDAAHMLLNGLHRYTSRLCGLYIEHGRSFFNWGWWLSAHVPAAKSRWGSVGRDMARVAAFKIIGKVCPVLGQNSLVGKLAAVTYETLPATFQDKWGMMFGISERVRTEVDQTMTRVGRVEAHSESVDASFD